MGSRKTLAFLNGIILNNPNEPILNIRVPDYLCITKEGQATLLSNRGTLRGNLVSRSFNTCKLNELLCDWLKLNLASGSLCPLSIFKSEICSAKLDFFCQSAIGRMKSAQKGFTLTRYVPSHRQLGGNCNSLVVTWRKHLGLKIRQHSNRDTRSFTHQDVTQIYS